MSKIEYDRDISTSARFAEGFFNGLKISVCHALTYGIYISKEDSVKHGTTFARQYFPHIARSSVFFTALMSSTYGMRQLVLSHRDLILSKLHSLHPIFKRNKALTDITIYFGIFLPLGTACNYI